MNESDFLCQPCKKNLRNAAKVSTSLGLSLKEGKFIAKLGQPDGPWSTSTCKFCRLQYSMRLDSGAMETEGSISFYELRAFSFLQTYEGVRYGNIDRQIISKDSITLVAVPAGFQGYSHRQGLKLHMWTKGHIFLNNSAEGESLGFAARMVPRVFDPKIVLHWLDYCNRHHKKLCDAAVEISNLKLIDCQERAIVNAPPQTRYIALSYVWGHSGSNSLVHNEIEKQKVRERPFLPLDIPRVVEDSMQVTKDLGFRYLWIDKYCIDQANAEEMRDQIRQMDLIYKGSEVTIIAASGNDENTGLPGVGTIRRTPQAVVPLGNITAISTMPHPHHTIKNSKWMTRGWTLQESILSRRRLVFTSDQVYFECNAMNCFESLTVPLDLVHTKQKDRYYSFMRSGLFTGRDEGLNHHIFGLPFGNFDDRSEPWSYHMKKYLILATNFTSRNLTKDSDSLHAFAGIMKDLETSKHPIKQVLGIPYLASSNSPDGTIQLDSVIAALCWRHINCCWSGGGTIRRREGFPSWTWAGWAGAVSWTDLFTHEEMDLVSLVENFHCELADGTLILLHQYHSQAGPGQGNPSCLLQFSAWLVPPSMILLDDSKKASVWRIDRFELQLHMSQFEGSRSDFLESLRVGNLECVFVAKGMYNSYFLVLAPQREINPGQSLLRKRVGVAEAIYSHNGTAYCRFADEVVFSWPKKDFRVV